MYRVLFPHELHRNSLHFTSKQNHFTLITSFHSTSLHFTSLHLLTLNPHLNTLAMVRSGIEPVLLRFNLIASTVYVTQWTQKYADTGTRTNVFCSRRVLQSRLNWLGYTRYVISKFFFLNRNKKFQGTLLEELSRFCCRRHELPTSQIFSSAKLNIYIFFWQWFFAQQCTEDALLSFHSNNGHSKTSHCYVNVSGLFLFIPCPRNRYAMLIFAFGRVC